MGEVSGKVVALGPDLTRIGAKYNRTQMLETLLQPSKVIDPKYLTCVVETVAGQIYSGLLVERTASVILLKDAQDKEIRLANDAVETMAVQQKSVMPDQILRDMTHKMLRTC